MYERKVLRHDTFLYSAIRYDIGVTVWTFIFEIMTAHCTFNARTRAGNKSQNYVDVYDIWSRQRNGDSRCYTSGLFWL